MNQSLQRRRNDKAIVDEEMEEFKTQTQNKLEKALKVKQIKEWRLTDKMDEQNLLAEDENEAEQPEINLEKVQDNCQSWQRLNSNMHYNDYKTRNKPKETGKHYEQVLHFKDQRDQEEFLPTEEQSYLLSRITDPEAWL